MRSAERAHEQADPDRPDRQRARSRPARPGAAADYTWRMARAGEPPRRAVEPPAGGGRPLDVPVRSAMESALGTDLSEVRVHDDPAAAGAADSADARAFTIGNDMYFGAGEYRPGSPDGTHLLAHELTHTLQQDDGPRLSARDLAVSSPGDGPELAAEAVATRVSAGGLVDSGSISGAEPVVARQAATVGPVPAATTAHTLPPPTPVPGMSPAPAPTPAGTAGTAAESVTLDSATFTPPVAVAETITARGTDVAVRFRNLASGTLRVARRGEHYSTPGRLQGVPLSHPFLTPLLGLGITPVLAIQIRESVITGYVSVQRDGRVLPNPSAILTTIKDHSEELGWVGLDVRRLPRTQNTLDAGTLRLQAQGLRVSLGGFVDGRGDFGLENETVTFSASATVRVRGLAPTELAIQRDTAGSLTGRVEVPVALASFSGNVIAEFGNGTLTVEGTAGYRTEKLSGQVTLLVTDAATARNVALQQLGPDAVAASAQDASGAAAPAAGPRPGPRALAGWGSLEFAFSEWLTGTAQVIVDSEGQVTVVGEIAPPAEIELFGQRDWVRNLFTIEVRTLYGVPLVGNVFLFANVGMDALAKLGPGKIYNIRIGGTYSTDPRVFNAFSLQGTLNISAYAGLRLRAEGGVGVELLGHDIKAGIGVNALAGIRGYVEATPTVGFREVADPMAGRRGEWYLNGHLEIAAQPFLGLGGDLFVELDSPWWSPAPDRKWTWPLGELEYPLPGQFGIGADVDYVIGSGQVPEISFGEVDFDKDKFMTDLMNDHVPARRGAEGEQPGQWSETPTGQAPAEPTATVASGGGATPDQPSQGRQSGSEGAVPAPGVDQRWAEGMRALGALVQASRSDPFSDEEIGVALAGIRSRHRFSSLTAHRRGAGWTVHAAMNPETDFPETIAAEPEARRGVEVLAEFADAQAHAGHVDPAVSRAADVAAAEASGLSAAEERVGRSQLSLPTRAQAARTTAEVSSVQETYMSAGARADLTRAQRRAALQEGSLPVARRTGGEEVQVMDRDLRCQHAEVKGLASAVRHGDTFSNGYVIASRHFCSACRSALIDAGAEVISTTRALFHHPDPAVMRDAMSQAIRIQEWLNTLSRADRARFHAGG